MCIDTAADRCSYASVGVESSCLASVPTAVPLRLRTVNNDASSNKNTFPAGLLLRRRKKRQRVAATVTEAWRHSRDTYVFRGVSIKLSRSLNYSRWERSISTSIIVLVCERVNVCVCFQIPNVIGSASSHSQPADLFNSKQSM